MHKLYKLSLKQRKGAIEIRKEADWCKLEMRGDLCKLAWNWVVVQEMMTIYYCCNINLCKRC